MARICKITRERRLAKAIARDQAKRAEWKKARIHPDTSYEERVVLNKKLERTAKSSPSRLVRRCVVCGRTKAVYRRVGLCRIHFREAAMCGDLPGVVKSSW